MPRRKPAEDRKADIVAALLELADRIGPDRLTTNDVAREVGVTQAAIFRHFPTKAALWTAVGEVLSDRLQGAWAEALAVDLPPRERLRALVGAQLAQIEACPALPAILFSRELSVENPALRETFRNLLTVFQGHLIAELRRLSEAGDALPDLSPDDAALFLISLVQGLAIRWTLGSRRFSLPSEGARLLDIQLKLLAPGKECGMTRLAAASAADVDFSRRSASSERS